VCDFHGDKLGKCLLNSTGWAGFRQQAFIEGDCLNDFLVKIIATRKKYGLFSPKMVNVFAFSPFFLFH